MKKIIVLFCIFFGIQKTVSQVNKVPELINQRGFIKVDYLSINMPDTPQFSNEPNMGFTGIHYNFQFNDFYSGVGLYGSVYGLRGGFFTLGINAGYKKMLTEKIFLDTGFHFGAGGGAAAPDGGGAFILPRLNFGYQFKNFALSTGYSYVNFFDKGRIRSSQIHLELQIPFDFEHAFHKELEKEFDNKNFQKTLWNRKTSDISVMMHLNNLNILSNSIGDAGVALKGKTIRLAGFEMSKFYNKNLFFLLKVDGAYSGIRAGYMDVFVGAGYQYSFNKNRTNILGKFSIGASGGGGVDTSGGFMIAPDISIEQKLFSSFYLALNGGYMLTPNSKFKTAVYGLGIKYKTNINGIYNDEINFKKSKFKGFEIAMLQDIYFNAERITNPTENMYQLSLQINFNINKNLFIAGQTSFANFGNAGAYGEGLVGFGVNSKSILKNRVQLFTQFLAGAAGGGNISTGEGLIVKPSAGLDYKLSKRLKLRSSVGYVKAYGGELSNTFINFGLKYHMSFLQSK